MAASRRRVRRSYWRFLGGRELERRPVEGCPRWCTTRVGWTSIYAIKDGAGQRRETLAVQP